MKVWHTHNIKNIGDDNLITFFWINEFYSNEDSDTFFEKFNFNTWKKSKL